MAKVDGPLFSLEARGKIADAVVYFPWKGRHVVRRWLKPTNPRDINQKLIRQKLAAIGKFVSRVTSPSTAMPNGSAFVQAMKVVTPAAQIWNAYTVKKAMNYVSDDSAFTNDLSGGLFGCDSTSDIWQGCAIAQGFNTLYATAAGFATTITPELQLIMGAYAAFAVELSNATDIYSSYPTNWTTAQISQFATDMTAAY